MQAMTKLEQIETSHVNGIVFVQVRKIVQKDDGTILFQEPHRFSFPAERDLEPRIASYDDALVASGYEPLDAKSWDAVRVAAASVADVRAAEVARIEAAEAAATKAAEAAAVEQSRREAEAHGL